MKLYIVRHGETTWNALGKMQGWMDSKLSDRGIANAKKLGKYLQHIDFDIVYSSPLGRAAETASHILGEKNIPIEFDEAFKEMGFGSWEGMYHDDIKQQYPEQQYNFWNAPHLYRAIDGESYEQLIDRVQYGISKLTATSCYDNILLVTHAAVIKAIFSIIYKNDIKDFWTPPFTYDSSLSILEVNNGELRVLMEPDIPHLQE